MSGRELQRIEVLSEVLARRRTEISAAAILRLSTRQTRRLLTEEPLSTNRPNNLRRPVFPPLQSRDGPYIAGTSRLEPLPKPIDLEFEFRFVGIFFLDSRMKMHSLRLPLPAFSEKALNPRICGWRSTCNLVVKQSVHVGPGCFRVSGPLEVR
jgi:hypothetical protein